jgi:hypothetical protein
MVLMLAVTEIDPATLDGASALWNRPEECGLCRGFKLQMVAYARRQECGTAERIGGREFWIAPNRSIDGHDR